MTHDAEELTSELCPYCCSGLMVDRKAKLVCDLCGFQVPCCEGGDCG
jgi:hypothetical protein